MGTDAIMAFSFFLGIGSVAWAAAFAWSKWLAHRYDEQKPITPTLASDTPRIERLEQAVETLAVELERIGEAQRYTVKLLEARLPQGLAAGGSSDPKDAGRVVTPH